MLHLKFGAALALAASATTFAQPCSPRWSTAFSQDGPDLYVNAVTAFDPDGPGPQSETLVIGGSFSLIGNMYRKYAAMWNGTEWIPLDGLSQPPACLAVVDLDGSGPLTPSLLAGGNFAGVQRWNGATWEGVGQGLPSAVRAIRSFDVDGGGPLPPALFAGTQQSSGVWRWDGQSWTIAGPPISGSVDALAEFDLDGAGPNPPRLIAGGRITAAGTTALLHIAAWDGLTWSAIGEGIDSFVLAVAAFDDDGPGPQPESLYAGLQTVGPDPGVARWTGSAWQPVGTRLLRSVNALLVADDDGAGPNPHSLIAFGDFDVIGGAPCYAAARLHQGEWVPMAMGFNTSALTGCVWDADGPGPQSASVIAGGIFLHAPVPSGAGTFTPRVAQWDGGAWQGVGTPVSRGADGEVAALHVHPQGGEQSLFAGGSFTAIDGQSLPRVARWNGAQWSPFGNFDGRVRGFATFSDGGPEPNLFAVGAFTTVGSIPAKGVARWNGQAWSGLGDGPVGFVQPGLRRLRVLDPDGAGPISPSLFAMGTQPTFNAVSSSLQYWNGSSWIAFPAIGYGTSDAIEFDLDGPGPGGPVLIAGGQWAMTPSNFIRARVASWDGQQWSELGPITTTLFTNVECLCAFDDDGPGPNPPGLYATGSFPGYVARWTGSAWVVVGSLPNSGTSNPGFELFIADQDGDGAESLFLVSSVGAYRLQGSTWLNLGVAGGGGRPLAIALFDDDSAGPRKPALYFGGFFGQAGGVSSLNIARLACPDSVECYANCDGSSGIPQLTAADFSCFMSRFAAGSALANCDASTRTPALNANDFICFMNNYVAGCP